MGTLRNQFRQIARRLGRAPMFTLAMVLTLGLGIGANTAIFSVVEGVLLKPLRYPRSAELVGVWHTAPGFQINELPTSPSMYLIYREQNRTFQDVGLYNGETANVTGVAEPEQVGAVRVTDGILPILGVAPMLGRGFSRADDSPGAADSVMLTYGYWKRKFGANPSIVGRALRVDGKGREVIGVMPESFHFLETDEPALILPFQLDRSKVNLGDFSYQAIARLKPGVTLTQASTDLARMIPIVNRSFPAPAGFGVKVFEEARIGPYIRPLKQVVVGDVAGLLWVVMGGVGVVLLIACANVANLLLVRAEGRQQELAIRAALGATRGRIASELLLESLLLGFAGSVAGLAIAWGALRALALAAPEGLPRLSEIGIDGPVLLYTLVVSLLASLLFGAVPIFKYAGARLNASLRDGKRALGQSRERHRTRSALVIIQVALALVLLISSGLLIRTFQALTSVQPGFSNPAEVQTLRLAIPKAEVPDAERVVRMQEEILRRISAMPGVISAASGTGVPMDGSMNFNPVFAEDRTYADGQLPPVRHFKFVSPGYYKTLGTPLVAGRDFSWSDVYTRRPVALVSESLAREYWREPSLALGKRVRASKTNDWSEIVGVVGNVYVDGVNKPAPTTVVWPVLMSKFWDEAPLVRRTQTFAIRSKRAGTESFSAEIRRAVWSVNASLPVADVHTLDYYYRNSMARTSFTLVMLGVAGGMALLLGTVGLYGVIAYSVSQRTREIGIRMALGAQRQELAGMFVRDGLLLTGVGAVCGLAAAFAVTRLMSSLLFHVSPADPVTYAAMTLALLAVSALASYLPSRRASRVDPVEALRAE